MKNTNRTLIHLVTIIFVEIIASNASWASEPGEVLWKFDLSNISGAFVTVGSDGTIYTADKNRLWAINPDGSVKWTFEEAGGAGGLPVAGGGQPVGFLPDGRIVAGAGHTIWVLDPGNGAVEWSYTWEGGFNVQIDNGPAVGPDGNIYATTGLDGVNGLGAFSLTADGQLRWQDDANPPLNILNASHSRNVHFTDSRMVFGFLPSEPGPPGVYAFDFQGNQTNYINYTCRSSPRTDPLHLLLAGSCGVQAIDLETDTILWSHDFGTYNILPVAGSDGVVYSGSWSGSARAISSQGQVLWTSPDVQLLKTLAINDEHSVFLYIGFNFGVPHGLGAIDSSSGQLLWEIPFEVIGGHNEFAWSHEGAFSPDGTVAYFTTRFSSNGAPGRLYAVSIAETAACPWDLDASGSVGTSDLLELFAQWGTGGPADFDGNGSVGTNDLLILFANWGTCL